MADIFALAEGIARAEQAFDLAERLAALIERHDPRVFARLRPNAPEDQAGFVDYVLTVMLPQAPNTRALTAPQAAPEDRSTPAGEARIRHLQATYSFYQARDTALSYVASVGQSVRDPDTPTFARLRDEFIQSLNTSNNYSTTEALMIIVILRAVAVVDGAEVIQPTLPATLLRLLISRSSSERIYQTLNWLMILPDEEFNTLMQGVQPRIAPDLRAVEIGQLVARVNSFPLMPELWTGANAWNNATLHAAVPTEGSASAAATTSVPLPAFFKPKHNNNNSSNSSRGRASVLGMDELNEALQTVGGAPARLAIRDGTLDLRPLAKLFAQLAAEEKKRNNRGGPL